jgi:ubiquitin carboxyl-terminal hydrolase 5/13
MTKLAIVAEREEDAYVHVTAVKCWACDPVNGAVLPEELITGTLLPFRTVHKHY